MLAVIVIIFVFVWLIIFGFTKQSLFIVYLIDCWIKRLIAFGLTKLLALVFCLFFLSFSYSIILGLIKQMFSILVVQLFLASLNKCSQYCFCNYFLEQFKMKLFSKQSRINIGLLLGLPVYFAASSRLSRPLSITVITC